MRNWEKFVSFAALSVIVGGAAERYAMLTTAYFCIDLTKIRANRVAARLVGDYSESPNPRN
jgi:hypothetical protein